jgi:RES domain-containing protein
MIVFRLAKAKYSNDLSGRGAEKSGGRWNSRGIAMVYTSETRALCTTEVAVHTPLGILPKEYVLVSINIPDDIKIHTLSVKSLPSDWNSIPHSGTTQDLGDLFVSSNNFAVMKVPSAVVPGDFNFLINPSHPKAVKVKIVEVVPFDFDQRLFLK